MYIATELKSLLLESFAYPIIENKILVLLQTENRARSVGGKKYGGNSVVC